MSFHRLEEMSWLEIESLDRDKTILFLPMGPLEEHGTHLPVGTDIFGARDMGELAAHYVIEEDPTVQAVLVPAVPLGCSQVTADFPGTITLRGTTFVRVIVEMCTSLARHGFRYMVLCNHHLDPIHVKAFLTAIQEVSSLYDVSIIEPASTIVYSNLNSKVVQYGLEMGMDMKQEIHADVKETSYIKYRYPHLLKGDVDQLPHVFIDINEGLRKGHSTFREMGVQAGYIGSPAKATVEYGRLYLEEGARLMADFALKLIRGEKLPEMSEKMKSVFDSHVTLD
jgi:creatinine amidohydrolase